RTIRKVDSSSRPERAMQIESYGEALAYAAAFWMAGLRDPETALEELGELSQQVSKRLRALAIITLLVKARNDLIAHNLIRSGRVRIPQPEPLAAAGIEVTTDTVS